MDTAEHLGCDKPQVWAATSPEHLRAAHGKGAKAALERTRGDGADTGFSLSSRTDIPPHAPFNPSRLASPPQHLLLHLPNPLGGYLHFQNSLLVLFLSSSPQNHSSAAVPISPQRSELFTGSLAQTERLKARAEWCQKAGPREGSLLSGGTQGALSACQPHWHCPRTELFPRALSSPAVSRAQHSPQVAASSTQELI